MSPLEIRVTHKSNASAVDETVTYGNTTNACDAIRNLCNRGILPKVEFIFGDGVVKEVSASCMC